MKCNVCGVDIKASRGNTSNASHHLRRAHRIDVVGKAAWSSASGCGSSTSARSGATSESGQEIYIDIGMSFLLY